MLRERNNQLLLKKKNSNQFFCDGGLTCLKNRRNSAFWLALVILLVTVFVSVVAYVRWYSLGFFVGSLFFVHWLGLAATAFIAALVPIYYVLKRRSPQKIKTLLKIHVFGNLFSFLFFGAPLKVYHSSYRSLLGDYPDPVPEFSEKAAKARRASTSVSPASSPAGSPTPAASRCRAWPRPTA